MQSTKNSIILNITKKREANLRFFIKEGSTSSDYNETTPSIQENEYTFGDLNEDTSYSIKIVAEAIDDEATEERYVTRRTLPAVIENVSIKCEVEYNEQPVDGTQWRKGSAVAKASIESAGDDGPYTLQTKKNEETWTEEPNKVFTENGTMYAKVLNKDKISVGSNSIRIDKLDNRNPLIDSSSAFRATVDKAQNKFTLNLEASDNESGIKKIEWNYKKASEETFTKEDEILSQRTKKCI